MATTTVAQQGCTFLGGVCLSSLLISSWVSRAWLGVCGAGEVTGMPLSLCSSHRLLSNNKITVLENGSFFGLRALEKL